MDRILQQHQQLDIYPHLLQDIFPDSKDLNTYMYVNILHMNDLQKLIRIKWKDIPLLH